MDFLIDAQLPPALARWLTARGYEAQHVGDLRLLEASDSQIWHLAASKGSVIVTKDEDFAVLRTLREEGPCVVWVRLGNCRTQALLAWFERTLPDLEALLASGEMLIELS